MRTIKKVVFRSILTVTIACFVVVIVYIFHRKINVSLNGVEYKLGTENKDIANPITFHMKGYVTRSLAGEQMYNGILDIDGLDIPVSEEFKKITMSFTNNSGWVIYYYFNKGTNQTFDLGMLKSNDDLVEFTLLIYEQKISKVHGTSMYTGSSWSPKDGIMIAAPATNREEALRISNKVLKGEWGELK